ncbi:MAG: hypothetical protein Q9166_000924 [cf. Caloplaca sp. 2 TL-2023]
MYILGDKYDIDDLKKLSAARFGKWCKELSDNIFWDPENYTKYLIAAVPLVYTAILEEDRALRISLTKALARYLNGNKVLLGESHFKEICLEYPDFGYDMMTEGMQAAHTRDEVKDLMQMAIKSKRRKITVVQELPLLLEILGHICSSVTFSRRQVGDALG